MKFPRRRFLQLAAGAAALPALPRVVRAQAYPTRPVRIVVGFPAGGFNDIVARIMAQWLSERLGQPFVIENRPGAANNTGTESVVRSSPDGYTLLLAGLSNATNASLYDKLNFNFVRDIAPVSGILSVPLIMLVNPSFPAKTVPEFIAYAKANPGKLNMASGGNGGPQHIGGELFKMLTAISMQHVPYRGEAPALNDLIGGQVQVQFASLTGSIGYVRSGQLRALGITTATRAEALPDVPIIGDFVPGYEMSGWLGVGAPKSTPVELIDKLNKEINAGLADPKVKGRIAELGAAPLTGSPADFGRLIADETDKWAKVIKFAGIKPA